MYTVSLQFGQAWVLDIFCGNSRDVQICPATTTILDILVVLRVLRLQHHQLLKTSISYSPRDFSACIEVAADTHC